MDSPQQMLEDYLAQVQGADVVEEMATLTGMPLEEVVSNLQIYAAEARFGYRMVLPMLVRGERILEAGAGLGMLSGFLRLQSYDVTPLEPYAGGFGRFAQMHSLLVEKGHCPPALSIKAEELDPKKHGRFDFIFSVNVLEHIPDLDGAIAGLAGVLAPAGRMWHTCPNYTVPYEPHFAVPLVPFFPAATQALLPERITGTELWKSLNFITVSRMRRIAKANGLGITFRPAMMAESFRRLEADPEFANRHKGLLPTVYKILKATGLLKLVEMLPPALNSPMALLMQKA